MPVTLQMAIRAAPLPELPTGESADIGEVCTSTNRTATNRTATGSRNCSPAPALRPTLIAWTATSSSTCWPSRRAPAGTPICSAALLCRDGEGVATVAEAARATGLLERDGTLRPIARRAIAALLPAQRRTDVLRRLAELQRARGGSVVGLACALLSTGIGGASVAATYEAAAEEALPRDAALSARLFAAALAAGRPLPRLAARWARAAALAGDLDSALRLADRVLAEPDRPDRAECAAVAAAALAHRGQLGRSAELYEWSGTGGSAAFAALARIATGRPAVPLDGTAGGGPPTLLSGAAGLMARAYTSR